jgi:prepilin-type N-terminal cleavage/methylation domain-containing protein
MLSYNSCSEPRAVHNLSLPCLSKPHAQGSRLQVRCPRLHRSLTSRRGVGPSGPEADLRALTSDPIATGAPNNRQRITDNCGEAGAFTLIELMVVIAIIAIMMALVAPAFTTLKSAGDVTSAAYTVKGVLDQARTYAIANNTYTWVGFFEEDVSQPSTTPQATPGTGRIVMSVVASKDGTMIYNPSSPAKITSTQLIQVGKLTKIENVHLAGDALFTAAPSTPTGSTFDYRPAVTYRIASPPNTSPPDSLTPFQYPVGNPEPAAQYNFVKAVQFSPAGEARIDNSTYSLQTAAEIGLRATHRTTMDTISPNLVAIQITGLGGDVRIYRR